MKKLLLVTVVALFSVGCASRLETVRIDPENWQTKGSSVRGVVYYAPKLIKLRHEFTQRSDMAACERVILKEEIVTLPDYGNPMAVIHKPSWFSSSEFGVTLENGMLASVNSNSTPQTLEILQQLVPPGGTSIADASQACDSGPIITAIKPVTFDEI